MTERASGDPHWHPSDWRHSNGEPLSGGPLTGLPSGEIGTGGSLPAETSPTGALAETPHPEPAPQTVASWLGWSPTRWRAIGGEHTGWRGVGR